MRAFVTGGGGFIGGELVRQLRARVTTWLRWCARSPAPIGSRELGCELIEGDLATMPAASLQSAIRGSDAVFHVAGSYRIGIRASERAAMYAANVVATQHVLDAAISVGVPRSVHVSTVNVYGNTHRLVVDETFERPQPPRYLSYYDETKHLAHLAAEERMAAGAPILIALPPRSTDPTTPQAGTTLSQAMAGTLPAITFPDLGLSLVHVEDLAAGILLVHDRGRVGEEYVLGG